MSPPDNDNIPAQLMELNSTLVKTLVERVTEVLEHINVSIENQGKIDKEILERLIALTACIDKILNNIKEISPEVEVAVKGLNDFLCDKPYHTEDRESLIIFLKRLSSIISQWTKQEQGELLDVIEDFPKNMIKFRKRLNKIYFIVFAAGLTTILASVGAPEWIMSLVKLLAG